MPDIENLLNIENEVTQVLSDLGVNEKLNEMDDFMNQNDLKVEITNENAVVTGLVTYTCTVKDKNNTALANKVVEWYKGTTLIGIDATDSNGISTFSHRVTEADIYDVHAIVKGTHAGDDIRMFVKDKNNALTFNQWSGGDSGTNFNPVAASNISAERSNDWSENGDYSIKLNIANNTNAMWRLLNYPTGEISNIDLKLQLYSPNVSLLLFLIGDYEGQHVLTQSVNITSSDEPTLVNLTSEVNADIDTLIISMQNPSDVGIFYVDDLSLIIQ